MVQIINCEMFTILLEQICTLLCWLIRPIADLRAPKNKTWEMEMSRVHDAGGSM